MRYGSLPGIGVPVSRLVLGTNQFTLERLAQAHDLLDAFVAAGGTTIDTAHVYANGESEQVLGRWLEKRGGAQNLVIITKGAHPKVDLRKLETAVWTPRVTPEAIAEDLDESLGRLGLSSVDLYLLHRDDERVPVGPLVRALDDLVLAGKIRAFGASNWTHQRVAEANAFASANGCRPFAISSPQFSLAVPAQLDLPGILSISGNAEAIDYYRRSRVSLLAWSSQGGGLFSDQATPNRIRRYDRPDNWERLRRARELAAHHGRTPTQVALAWALAQPLDLYAVIGANQPAHLTDSLETLSLRLTEPELAWLNLQADLLPAS